MSFGVNVASGIFAYGDEPLLPPAAFDVRSPSGQCLAHADLTASRITGLSSGKEKLWVIPEYRQFIELGDDCHSVMALYRGDNLLDRQDRHPATVVLSFFRFGELIRQVKLGELYSDVDVLPQTVSHYLWVKASGWEDGKWFIRTVDNRTILFNPASGERLN